MMSRRELGTGLAALTALSVSARVAAGSDKPETPWTRTGLIQRAGGQLHYAIAGTAKEGQLPLVLLHKLGGWVSDWRHVVKILAKERQIIAFDLPGHGQSRWEGKPPYIQSTTESAALLAGALTELGIDKIDLVGASLGGCVATAFAAAFPDRVRKLGVMSSVLMRARTLAEVKKNIDEGEAIYYTQSGYPLPMETALSAKLMGLVNAEAINQEQNASRHQAGLWIQPHQRGVATTDFLSLMPRVKAPTLLMYGANDPTFIAFRPAGEAGFAKVQTELVPNAGAFAEMDNPEATAKILSAFLRKG